MSKARKQVNVPIPDVVEQQQCTDIGECLVAVDRDGIADRIPLDGFPLLIACRFSERLKAECSWFEKMISHGPSIGSFYEHQLRSMIAELLPSRNKVGHGFILDTHAKRCSPQFDTIVYSDHRFAPIYRNNDFVVVQPSAVIALAEVKKTLTHADIRQITRLRMGENLGSTRRTAGLQNVNIFAYGSKSKTLNLLRTLAVELESYIKSFSGTAPEGETVTYGMRHLILPNIYFLDRKEFILANLRYEGGHTGKIDLKVCYSGDFPDGLHQFLWNMCLADQETSHEVDGTLLTFPLLNVSHCESVPGSVFLFSEVSARELAQHFPDDIRFLSSIGDEGRVPYGALINSCEDWRESRSLRELVSRSGFRWLFAEPNSKA